MPDVALFVEDFAHQQVVGAVLQRLAEDRKVKLNLNWRSTRQGHGRVLSEFQAYLCVLKHQGGAAPDFIVVATDANCKGLNERAAEFRDLDAPAPLVMAIPDPHIERWLLLDGAGFKAVFGKGCDAPDQKCDRDRYKQKLIEAIHAAGIIPALGGIEFAEDIIRSMNLDRAANADPSLRRFMDQVNAQLRNAGRSKA